MGGCTTNPGWMITFCPKSCNACDIRDPKVRCTRQFLNVTDEPIYEDGVDGKPGSLAKMFAGIEDRFGHRYDITVHSTDPWIVTFDNFFNEEEAAAILGTVNDK